MAWVKLCFLRFVFVYFHNVVAFTSLYGDHLGWACVHLLAGRKASESEMRPRSI